MTRTPSLRAPAIILALALALALPLLGAGSAAAQGLGLSNVRVSSNPEGWTEGQGPFNAAGQVHIFINFPTGQHGGFTMSGVCVISLAATDAELYRMPIPASWMQPGWDAYRTNPFWMSWPQAAVTVTCVPDYNPGLALAVTLQPNLWTGGWGNTTQPVVPVHDGAPACRDAVLARGWDPSSLTYCDGVNESCALTLIERGWDPSGLPGCVGTEETCAVELLNRGWDPSGLYNCAGVDATCARELLNRGWDPTGLPWCQNVDSQCAVSVLQAGYNPSNLSSCGR